MQQKGIFLVFPHSPLLHAPSEKTKKKRLCAACEMLLDAVSIIANKARVPLECPQVGSHESLAFVRLAVANFRFVRSGRRVLYLVGISAIHIAAAYRVTRAALRCPLLGLGCANANPATHNSKIRMGKGFDDAHSTEQPQHLSQIGFSSFLFMGFRQHLDAFLLNLL
jgi:hypothetical protein